MLMHMQYLKVRLIRVEKIQLVNVLMRLRSISNWKKRDKQIEKQTEKQRNPCLF